MKLKVVDCKNNEMIKVKIELNQYMYLVVPEIVNHKFDYMRPRIMNVRAKYMNMYLENKELYKEYEYKIYDEIKDLLITEAERIHDTEGIMYYTI